MNIRTCKLCGKQVDFDEPYCNHETMEESAWLDIASRQKTAARAAADLVVDDLVHQAAIELGIQAGRMQRDQWRLFFDNYEFSAEKHRSDIEFVNQNARGK